MKAKKHLGQNFLQSKKIVDRMVNYSTLKEGETVLEIGPGKGILTEALLQKEAIIIAIEKDRELIPILNQKFAKQIENKTLSIVEGDVLTFPLEKYIKTPFRVIANIPYYITGEILRHFLEMKDQPISMTLLVQKEVAQRIVARDKKESILSLSVKVFGTPHIAEIVKKTMFKPVPKVDSAIIHIDNISHKKLKDLEISSKKFFEIIKLGFAQKRKTLVNNLSSLNKSGALKEHLISIGRSEKVRAEDLSLSEWLEIVKIY